MVGDEDCRTAVLGKTERTVGWEGNGELTMTRLVRHRPPSLSHSFTLDLVIGGELEGDARRIMAVLPKRFARDGLTIPPTKTA